MANDYISNAERLGLLSDINISERMETLAQIFSDQALKELGLRTTLPKECESEGVPKSFWIAGCIYKNGRLLSPIKPFTLSKIENPNIKVCRIVDMPEGIVMTMNTTTLGRISMIFHSKETCINFIGEYLGLSRDFLENASIHEHDRSKKCAYCTLNLECPQ